MLLYHREGLWAEEGEDWVKSYLGLNPSSVVLRPEIEKAVSGVGKSKRGVRAKLL